MFFASLSSFIQNKISFVKDFFLGGDFRTFFYEGNGFLRGLFSIERERREGSIKGGSAIGGVVYFWARIAIGW